VSPADTCLTVQKLTDIAARFDPLWRKFPKDLTTTTAEVANGLAEKLAAVQDELADVPKVIANEQVTAGRQLLGQAVDLAVSGWGDLAQSIRAKDTSLEAQASGEIAQVGDAYHAFITDIFSMSACF